MHNISQSAPGEAARCQLLVVYSTDTPRGVWLCLRMRFRANEARGKGLIAVLLSLLGTLACADPDRCHREQGLLREVSEVLVNQKKEYAELRIKNARLKAEVRSSASGKASEIEASLRAELIQLKAQLATMTAQKPLRGVISTDRLLAPQGPGGVSSGESVEATPVCCTPVTFTFVNS